MWAKRGFPIIVVSVLLMISAILMYYFQLKQDFHIDELYTYGLSNSYYQPFPFAKNQWVSGEYYQNYLSTTLETRFQFDSVYFNQTQDVHPPFYYFIIHLISSFLPGVFSKWIGLSVNGVIHLMIFGVLFNSIKTLTKNRWAALFGAAFWALSVGALSSASFIRMYHLVSLLQVSLLSVSLKLVLTEKLQKRSLVGMALCCLLGGLTHYYFYLYAFGLVLTICVILLFQRRIRDVFLYGGSALLGVVGALVSFPAVLTHLTATNRGQEVLSNLEHVKTSNRNPFAVFVKEELLLDVRLRYIVLIGLVFVVLLLVSLWKTKKAAPLWGLIGCGLPAAAYIFVVQAVSHYQTPRYIYSIYPAIVMSLVCLIYYGLTALIRSQRLVAALIGIALTAGISVSLLTQKPDYLYGGHQALQSLVIQPEEQTIFVLGDQYWKVAQVAAEVKEFEAIYPSNITNSLTNLPDKVEADNFYVLMLPHEKNNYERVMQDIAKKYDRTIASETKIRSDRILYYLVGDR